MNNGRLYAIALGWPVDGASVIHTLGATDKVTAVRLLGATGKVTWPQQADGLHMKAADKPPGAAVYVYVIELAGLGQVKQGKG